MAENLPLRLLISKMRKFIDTFNSRLRTGKTGNSENNVSQHQGLKVIDISGADQSMSMALQIYSELGKQHEYYIKIKWDAKKNKFVVCKNLMPYGVNVQKLLQGRTLETFENVADLIKEVYRCCCAFHNRQKQVQDMKDFLKRNHWHMEVFFSHTLLYMRIGFYPLHSDKEAPPEERRHVYVELHYEQHQIRPSEITIDCTGFSDKEMEELKFQFSVFKKFTLEAALEFALVKVEEADEAELVSASSSGSEAIPGPSGTQQQQQAKSPSESSFSSS